MAQFKEESLMLTTLNDDCIFKILEWLHLDDIYSYSRACKRIQILCENYFRRKFRGEIDQTVKIRFTDEGYIRHEDRYVTYFNNVIKNLHIAGGFNTVRRQNIDKFLKGKCDPNLKEITINCVNEVNDLFRGKTSRFLRNVEIVNLIRTSSLNTRKFFEYCPNLTSLSLGFMLIKMIEEILECKFPKLKHFHFEYLSSPLLNPEKFKRFFQQNNQIQCVQFCEFYTGCDDIDHDHIDNQLALECIETIVDFASNLEYLFLKFDKSLTKHFEQICGHLEKLCDRNRFKYLELNFGDNIVVTKELLMKHAKRLANFEQLKTIHVHSLNQVMDLNQIFSPFVHLKSIVIEQPQQRQFTQLASWLTDQQLMSIIDKTTFIALPQLKEITIHSDNPNLMDSYLMLFTRHWANIKVISVLRVKRRIRNAKFPLAALNRARAKLENAQQMTIFTDYCDNTTNLCQKMVKLQCVKHGADRDSLVTNRQYCMSSSGYYHYVQHT